MAHYLVLGRDSTEEGWSASSPVEAVSRGLAVDRAGMAGYEEIEVYEIATDSIGNPILFNKDQISI